MSEIHDKIKSLVSSNDVMLFMKGDPEMPMCGFSSVVVQILKNLHVQFSSVNVLEDENIRQGIKDFSDWPTIPQVYVKGEFIGGCDIMREMYTSGELKDLLVAKGVVGS